MGLRPMARQPNSTAGLRPEVGDQQIKGVAGPRNDPHHQSGTMSADRRQGRDLIFRLTRCPARWSTQHQASLAISVIIGQIITTRLGWVRILVPNQRTANSLKTQCLPNCPRSVSPCPQPISQSTFIRPKTDSSALPKSDIPTASP